MKLSHAYVFPGAGERAQDYNLLNEMLKRRGFNPIPIDLIWNRESFMDWMYEAEEQVQDAWKKRGDFRKGGLSKGYDISIGFSYGGVVGLMLPIPHRIHRISCSVPNVFDETIRKKLDAVTKIRVGITVDWEEIDLAKDIPFKNWELDTFICGTEESKVYNKSAQKFEEMLGADFSVSSHLIQGLGHRVNSPEYVEAIEAWLI